MIRVANVININVWPFETNATPPPSVIWEPTLGSPALSDRQTEMTDEITRDGYISVRLTIEHEQLPAVESMLNDVLKVMWYICYPHTGKGGQNEHFHILIPGNPTSKAECQRIRDVIKRTFGARKCQYTVKHPKDNLLKAITYCSHEQTEPATKGDVQKWIDDAPAWVEPTEYEKSATASGRKRKLHQFADLDGELIDLGITVNRNNVVSLAMRHYRIHKLEHLSFQQTLRSMIQSRRYNCSSLGRDRADLSHAHEFSYRMGFSTDDEMLDRLCHDYMDEYKSTAFNDKEQLIRNRERQVEYELRERKVEKQEQLLFKEELELDSE